MVKKNNVIRIFQEFYHMHCDVWFFFILTFSMILKVEKITLCRNDFSTAFSQTRFSTLAPL